MRVKHTIQTIAPSLALLCLIWASWKVIEEVLMYAPLLLCLTAALTLVPLGVQIARWDPADGRQAIHPFGLLLPITLVLIVLLWPYGELTAKQLPSLCEASVGFEIVPERPGKLAPAAKFILGASGRGNLRYQEFSNATIIYTNLQRDTDLNVLLPDWQGFYSNSYTTHFPVTRERLLEYARKSDDFPEGEAVSIANQIWARLNDIKEKRNLPKIVYRGWDEPMPSIVYWVPYNGAYLMTAALCVPVLILVSGLLACCYEPRIKPRNVKSVPGLATLTTWTE